VNCDPIARWYRWLEYLGFGGALERRRCAFLAEVSNARRILALGDGDGRFLARLVERMNPETEIDYIDLSRRMLELARRRIEASGHAHPVTFLQADALAVALPSAEYDLIVTHFFLDCFNETEASKLVHRVSHATFPHARWLISEFRQPEGGWRSAWAWLWLRVLYLFFRVTTGLKTRRLINHHPLLMQAGFRLSRTETARCGSLVSELWARP
jgi:ubiquinone/menaquinone biosynthesis C-methylase UbiE